MSNITSGNGDVDLGSTIFIVVAGITGLLFAAYLFRIIAQIRYLCIRSFVRDNPQLSQLGNESRKCEWKR